MGGAEERRGEEAPMTWFEAEPLDIAGREGQRRQADCRSGEGMLGDCQGRCQLRAPQLRRPRTHPPQTQARPGRLPPGHLPPDAVVADGLTSEQVGQAPGQLPAAVPSSPVCVLLLPLCGALRNGSSTPHATTDVFHGSTVTLAPSISHGERCTCAP